VEESLFRDEDSGDGYIEEESRIVYAEVGILVRREEDYLLADSHGYCCIGTCVIVAGVLLQLNVSLFDH
jgi:hypothetical protein